MLTYSDLGVLPFINASGTITTLGGSRMPPQVIEAMRLAAGMFVNLHQLHRKAGGKLAHLTGVPAAFVSCGAASGVQLSAAACLTGTDREFVRKLPDTAQIRREFIISLVDSHTYIHQGIQMIGGELVRVGTETSVSTGDIVEAIGPKTAGIVFFLGKQSKSQLAEILPQAAKYGVPVVVDAAAQLPPRSNLTEIVAMGASLVVFSGGKGIRGPQSSGLVLGKEEFVEAVRLNSSPQSAVGRGMKVGKEEIMGLLTAVELFLSSDEPQELLEWYQRVKYIVDAVAGIDGIDATVLDKEQDAAPDIVPRAYIRLDDAFPKTLNQVMYELRGGEPAIVTGSSGSTIIIDPMTMVPGEAEVIAKRLCDLLRS